MISKYKRTNFLEEFTTDSGKNEYDLISSNWDLFEINNQITYGIITKLDMNRPDVLSYRVYGDSQYWWILCKFNHIDDVWNDMELGGYILIPSLADIEEFYDRVKKKIRI